MFEAGVPKRHGLAILSGIEESSDQDHGWRMISDILDRDAIAVLLGPSGVGKTLLACAILSEYIRSTGRLARYTRAWSIIEDYRDRVYAKGLDAARWRAVYVAPRILVIDEYEHRRNTEDEDLLLGSILDDRYGACRPTILISNLRRESFLENVGPSVESRIDEGGGFIIAEDWPDRRARR